MEGRYTKISAIAGVVSALAGIVRLYINAHTEVEQPDLESGTNENTHYTLPEEDVTDNASGIDAPLILDNDHLNEDIYPSDIPSNNIDRKEHECDKQYPPISCLFRRDIK